MDSRFAGPLGLVAERALLKEHGVEKVFSISVISISRMEY